MFAEGVEMGKPEPPLDSEKTSEREEAKEKPKRNRRTKDELGLRNLPVIEAGTIIPDDVLANPEGYREIGRRPHDTLDYQPARLQWLRSWIPEFASKEDKQAPPLKAPAPLPVIPKTMISASLGASLLIDKFCDHLPHYRQSQRFFREQSALISHKTINAWAQSTANLLSPIAECIATELRSTNLLQVDETPMHYLDPGAGKARTGYIWVMRCPKTGASYYHWEAGRSAQALMRLLGLNEKTNKLAFKGLIQCDGYICYETLANAYQSIKLGACMAHIRRKFLDDASLIHEPWIRYFLRAVKALYRIERRLRKTNAPPDLVERTRQRYASPIIANLESLLKEQLPIQRPASSCSKAIKYALNQWEQLKLYLKTGSLPIDNNGVENAIRPCKLGLKNYLFFGSLAAGNHNAAVYTLIENCKAAGVHLRKYLIYAIESIGKLPASELTPAKVAEKWKAETAASAEAAA